VIGEPGSVHQVGPEILDTHYSGKGADLEILRIDRWLFYLAALDLRIDDLVWRVSNRRSGLVSPTKEALCRSAARQAQYHDWQR
jgi:hypothetical protein